MKKQLTALAVSGMLALSSAYAGQVGSVTTFSANTAAKAAEVNANFTALINAINDNATRIADLEAAAADSSVAGKSYRVFSLNSEVAAGDGNSDGTQDFTNISSGSLDGVLAFDPSNGSGTMTLTADDVYEANLPSNDVSDFSDSGFTPEAFTYTQSGNTVTVTFSDPIDGDFVVNFIVTADGSMMVARVVEPLGPTTFGDGSPGESAFLELLIGIRQ